MEGQVNHTQCRPSSRRQAAKRTQRVEPSRRSHQGKPHSSTLSKFDYTYDAAGNILTWQQQADSDAPTLWTYGYDRADQLTSAVHQTTGGTPSLIKRYAYSYD